MKPVTRETIGPRTVIQMPLAKCPRPYATLNESQVRYNITGREGTLLIWAAPKVRSKEQQGGNYEANQSPENAWQEVRHLTITVIFSWRSL